MLVNPTSKVLTAISSKSAGSAGEGDITLAPYNFRAPSDPTLFKPHIHTVIYLLSKRPLSHAFFDEPPAIPVSLLEQTILSARKKDNHLTIRLANGQEVPLPKDVFRAAL
ncbi:hypothetical protein L1887_14820 [Cichorium endivia]|nr:hypothetical protein L1887_14820 [Cichorium endivia]